MTVEGYYDHRQVEVEEVELKQSRYQLVGVLGLESPVLCLSLSLSEELVEGTEKNNYYRVHD